MLANQTVSENVVISQSDLQKTIDGYTAAILHYECKALVIRKKRKEFEERYKNELEIFREFI